MNSVSLELHRAVVAQHEQATAALAERVQELEKALDAAQDDAARLRAALEMVEFVPPDGPSWGQCAWCRAPYPGHAPDCARQAALAQTQEVKA